MTPPGPSRHRLAHLAVRQAGEDDLGGIGHRRRRGAGDGALGDEVRHRLRPRVVDMQPHILGDQPLAIGAPIWPSPRKPIFVTLLMLGAPSGGDDAAIHRQDMAGDDAAGIGGEVEYGFRHVDRLAEAEQMRIRHLAHPGIAGQ